MSPNTQFLHLSNLHRQSQRPLKASAPGVVEWLPAVKKAVWFLDSVQQESKATVKQEAKTPQLSWASSESTYNTMHGSLAQVGIHEEIGFCLINC